MLEFKLLKALSKCQNVQKILTDGLKVFSANNAQFAAPAA